MLPFYLSLIDDPQYREFFIDLYRKNRLSMFNRANRILHNDSDAEDAVHEAFIKIAENIEKIYNLDGQKQKKYIVTIIDNKAIDLYRAKQARPEGELLDLVEYAVIDTYQDDTLAQCIMKLPEIYKEILLLRYDQDYTLKEIASILDISYDVAGKRLQRARDKLYEIYQEEGML